MNILQILRFEKGLKAKLTKPWEGGGGWGQGKTFGTRGWRSNRSAFPTGNDVSAHYFHRSFLFSRFFFSPPFVATFSHRRGARIKKPILRRLFRAPKNPFQTPPAILGPPGGHFGFCRRCDIAGSERVPPLPPL